jgi:YgiT-type zinc finger domain-containing protein
MICVICKTGVTRSGVTTITLERGKTTLVFKQVPAQVCENCGEAYLDELTTQTLLEIAENAAQSGVQVEVRNFAAPILQDREELLPT